MKRILLIRIDYKVWGGRTVSPPLGILYLASLLRKKSVEPVEVAVLDLRLLSRSMKKFEAKIREFRPDILGISALTLEDLMLHKKADLAKKILPDCKIIVGGPHATIYHENILKDHNIDYAVIGEGEKTFLDLVNALITNTPVSRIKGISYQENGQITLNNASLPVEDLDSLPFPAWDLLNLDSYAKLPDMNRCMGKGRNMGIITSRACPYQCSYCHSIFGKTFRARSPENVLECIKVLKEKYAIKEIQIFDDCFNFDLDRAKRIGELLCSQVPNIRISFPNGVRGDRIDREFLEIFRKAGAYEITVALETASPRLQKLVRKNLDLDKARQTIDMADRLGYFVQGFFMIGFPSETPAEIQKTIDFAVDSPLDMATFFSVIPYKNSGLMKLFRDEGLQGDLAFEDCHYSSSLPPYQKMTGINLMKIKRNAYLRFYANPRRFFKSILKVPNKTKYIFNNFIRMGAQYFWHSVRRRKTPVPGAVALLILLFKISSQLLNLLGIYLEEEFSVFVPYLCFVF